MGAWVVLEVGWGNVWLQAGFRCRPVVAHSIFADSEPGRFINERVSETALLLSGIFVSRCWCTPLRGLLIRLDELGPGSLPAGTGVVSQTSSLNMYIYIYIKNVTRQLAQCTEPPLHATAFYHMQPNDTHHTHTREIHTH